MYGKIFDSIYEGTLYGQWEAIVTFQQMIVLCDADGIIDMTPPAISARTSIPLEIIQKGIEILEKPDPYSRTPDENGCRIALIDSHKPWGWYIINHKKYRNLQDADTVRAQTRERVKKHRALKRPVTDGNAQKRHTNTDTDTNNKTYMAESFGQFWVKYPRKVKKQSAFKAWCRVKPINGLADIIIASVEKYKQTPDWKKDNGKFIPHPTSFLNQRRWEDEIQIKQGDPGL